NVKGTSTATAIVAVSPGMAPITIPALTPAKAIRKLAGDSTSITNSKPDMLLPIHALLKPSLSGCRRSMRLYSEILGGGLQFGLGFIHKRFHLVRTDIDHGETAVFHLLDELRIGIDLSDDVSQRRLLVFRRGLGDGKAAIDATDQVIAQLLERRAIR